MSATLALKLSAADRDAVARLRSGGWKALHDAAHVVARVAELETTLGTFVGDANAAIGADRKAGYARIAQLTKLARELDAVGIDPREHTPTLTLNRLASILDAALLSQWHASRATRGLKAADVWPTIAAILAEHGPTKDALAAIVEYRDSLEPQPRGEAADTARGDNPTDTADTADTAAAAAEIVAPTPRDAMDALANVERILSGIEAIHAEAAKALVMQLHNLADFVAEIPLGE